MSMNTKVSATREDLVPYSKGADYRELISEALSQPNIDDFLSDQFTQSFASRLSLKGQSILNWSTDQDFLAHSSSNPHAPASFLSLNLHVLAEQLESVELSKRLFVDADLLPSDKVQQIPQNPKMLVPESKPAKLNDELEKLLDSFGPLDALKLDDHDHGDVMSKETYLNPSSSSKSKVSTLDDDFDSWLDTL